MSKIYTVVAYDMQNPEKLYPIRYSKTNDFGSIASHWLMPSTRSKTTYSSYGLALRRVLDMLTTKERNLRAYVRNYYLKDCNPDLLCLGVAITDFESMKTEMVPVRNSMEAELLIKENKNRSKSNMVPLPSGLKVVPTVPNGTPAGTEFYTDTLYAVACHRNSYVRKPIIKVGKPVAMSSKTRLMKFLTPEGKFFYANVAWSKERVYPIG